ncbi:MAG: hypothetical protein ACK4N5_01530, partial [Myxococcales bacterium]
LVRLAIRDRRAYDARRTFTSLALGDGARKDVLRWVTHGPGGDIVDVYTTLPWDSLCAEVAKLRISLREGVLLPLQAVGGHGHSPGTAAGGNEKAPQPRAVAGPSDVGDAGF